MILLNVPGFAGQSLSLPMGLLSPDVRRLVAINRTKTEVPLFGPACQYFGGLVPAELLVRLESVTFEGGSVSQTILETLINILSATPAHVECSGSTMLSFLDQINDLRLLRDAMRVGQPRYVPISEDDVKRVLWHSTNHGPNAGSLIVPVLGATELLAQEDTRCKLYSRWVGHVRCAEPQVQAHEVPYIPIVPASDHCSTFTKLFYRRLTDKPLTSGHSKMNMARLLLLQDNVIGRPVRPIGEITPTTKSNCGAHTVIAGYRWHTIAPGIVHLMSKTATSIDAERNDNANVPKDIPCIGSSVSEHVVSTLGEVRLTTFRNNGRRLGLPVKLSDKARRTIESSKQTKAENDEPFSIARVAARLPLPSRDNDLGPGPKLRALVTLN